jgi:DNA-binding NarL/FixJ family response regulator
MSTTEQVTLRLLDDPADVLDAVAPLVRADPRIAIVDGDAPPGAIGLVGWRAATRAELATLADLRARHAGPLVALLAALPSTRGARALAARLDGTLLAAEAPHALVPTLAAVAAGQCVVPKTIRQLVDRPPLSPRERQILAMVVLDFSNAEIARKLFVTESNVKNHLSSAFEKLGVRSRSAAAELILDHESGLGPGILRISPEETLPTGEPPASG